MPSGSGFFGAFLDTVGIELEGIGLSRGYVQDILLPDLYRRLPEGRLVNLTRDASTELSVEGMSTNLGTLQISTHTKEARKLRSMGRGNNTIFGYELYTSPMTIPEMEKLMYPLVFSLVQAGDFVSDRASTHYHVGFANNLSMMKKALRVCLNLDPVLLRLGGMGRRFRGHSNLAAYARPLMKAAAVMIGPGRSMTDTSQDIARRIARLGSDIGRPIPVRENTTLTDEELEAIVVGGGARREKSAGKYAEIINPIAALDATSLQQFWASFGVIFKPGGGTDKYHPARYTSINFYAIPQHGTLEFRHFNQSQNPQLIISVGKFVRASVEMAVNLNKAEVEYFHPVPSEEEISLSDATDIVYSIIRMCHDKEVENIPTDNEVALILETIGQSSFVALPATPVITHIRDKFVTEDIVQLGQLNIVKKVLPSKHIDIHNIADKECSIMDEFNS
jgi:hypothetical protein